MTLRIQGIERETLIFLLTTYWTLFFENNHLHINRLVLDKI